MSDVLADPRCSCPISTLTGLRCRACPRRARPAAGLGLDIPTFRRR